MEVDRKLVDFLLDCQEYYVLTGGLAFTLDEANGRIYEYIAPNEYFTVYHYYTLVQ